MASVIDRAVLAVREAGVACEVVGDEVVVPPAALDGFVVRLRMVTDRQYVVHYDEWRHDFDRAEDAYDCFEYGLSTSCRLKITRRGDEPVLWQVEKREFGMWAPASHVTRRCSWAFWRPRRIEYRQNGVFGG